MGQSDIEKIIRPGDVVAGKYRIERVLGDGGMGVVVAAYHLQLDELVAMKFLLPDWAKKAEAITRFEREARAAVKIKSEHVVRVLDVGQLPTGEPFMVMEFLQGVDLAHMLQDQGALSVETATDFILQACEAIVEAHAIGIVHRDLKPANLFCIRGTDGVPSIKVLDFGISKTTALVDKNSDMTQTQTMLGSPLYMSPEQMQSSRAVDTRTDIWSLGVILFQLLTNRLPFEATELPALVLKIVHEPTPSVRALRPELPISLEHVVSRCLEKDRDRRFRDIGELAHALAEFVPPRARMSIERIQRVVQTSKLNLPGSTQFMPETPSTQGAPRMLHASSSPMVAAPQSQLVGPPTPPISDGRAGQGITGPQLLGPPPTPTPHPMTSTTTGGSWGGSSVSIPQTFGVKTIAILGLAIMFFAGLVTTGVFVIRPLLYPSNQVDAGGLVASAAPSASSAPIASSPASSQPAAASASMSASASPPTPSTPPTIEPRPIPPTPNTAIIPAPAVDAAAPTPPSTKTNCNPPYYYDAQGNRVFKKECI